METLTRHDYLRGKQRFILQGMAHIAPEHVYRQIQQEMDEAVAVGYQVLAEGIIINRHEFQITPAEQNLCDLLQAMVDFYKNYAQREQLATQLHSVRYPPETINADLTLLEIAREIKRQGIYIPSEFLEFVQSESFANVLHRRFVGEKEAKKTYFKMASLKFGSRSNSLLKITRECRNLVAVRFLEDYMRDHPEGKIYMHYGDSHVPGISRLVQKRGWFLLKTEEIQF